MSEAAAATTEEENQRATITKPVFVPHHHHHHPFSTRRTHLEPSSSSSSSGFMDLDFADLDPSWTFDQIPTSPLLISAADQPFSPLWAFADADERNIRISADFSRISSCMLPSIDPFNGSSFLVRFAAVVVRK